MRGRGLKRHGTLLPHFVLAFHKTIADATGRRRPHLGPHPRQPPRRQPPQGQAQQEGRRRGERHRARLNAFPHL